MEHVVLSNGVQMPKLGFGVFQIPREETEKAVTEALHAGYQHIDTAQSYMNELGLLNQKDLVFQKFHKFLLYVFQYFHLKQLCLHF